MVNREVFREEVQMRRFSNSFIVTLGAAALLWPTMAMAQQPDMSIEVVGAGCNSSTGPTSCYVAVGHQFTVQASLDNLVGLPAGYMAFQIRLNHSPGLTRQDRPGTEELGSPPFWPECDIPVEAGDPSTYAGGCAILFFPWSTYTGLLMEVDYTCPATPSQETVTMVHGLPNDTVVFDDLGNPVVPNGQGPNESLTIHCVEAGLDHFQCWQVKDLKNPKFEKRDSDLTDQFAAGTVEVKKPFLICTPADKDGLGINNPTTHQCCYKIKGTKLDPPTNVEIEDQFGTLELEVKKAKFLCQPCSKTVLP
jgi:hypothetical protein